MKKRGKTQAGRKPKNNEGKDAVTLGDLINAETLSKLKEAQNELNREETAAKEREEQKKREERKLREKNKSFEELLNESTADWRSYK
ncbi:YqkE family protein [Peribacillus kribbensis]|uniref:YqkE family protein n=1 Tax=Peribacillus kribbensis TaxID=356658 RepID=UPI000417AC6C|nr:YqkE family protein [Peribacillus kribbensis]